MRLRYEKCMNSRVFKDPLQKINEKYIMIDMKVKRMQNSIVNLYNSKKTHLIKNVAKIDALSPLKTLTRGYSIVQLNGKVVKSVGQIKKDDQIDIRLTDGTAKAKIM